MNTSIIGRVYHVVDKATQQVVKVGSTIRTLEKRWSFYDKEKFSNHYLRLVKEIRSSEKDWYDPEVSDCPFLWHLMAVEHLEIVRMKTFDKGPLSNKISPLVQKCIGFDPIEAGKIGAVVGGIISRDERLGIHGMSDKARKEVSKKGGLTNVKSGHLQSISSMGGKVSGAIVGKRNAESGWMREVQQMGLGLGGKIGGPKGMHIRWHVRRGMISPNCKHCAV